MNRHLRWGRQRSRAQHAFRMRWLAARADHDEQCGEVKLYGALRQSPPRSLDPSTREEGAEVVISVTSPFYLIWFCTGGRS
jgi:hypothetical protein